MFRALPLYDSPLLIPEAATLRFAAGRRDAGTRTRLTPGSYTVHVTESAGRPGLDVAPRHALELNAAEIKTLPITRRSK